MFQKGIIGKAKSQDITVFAQKRLAALERLYIFVVLKQYRKAMAKGNLNSLKDFSTSWKDFYINHNIDINRDL